MTLLSIKSIQGKREYMEDRHAFLKEKNIMIALICDGHGGHQVADDTSRELPLLILHALQTTTGTNVKHAEAIRNTIIEWGSKVHKRQSGSTLTGIAVKNDIVYIFNIGDSHTCMKLLPGSFTYMLAPLFDQTGKYLDRIRVDYMQKQFFCTGDHDSSSPIEVDRVRDAGGRIADNRLNGILSVTRALGDGDIGPGISFIPDIYWTKKTLIDGPIVMYSDGVYELQRYTTTHDFSDKYLYERAKNFDSANIVQYAYDNGSDDNLTAMVVKV